MHWIHEPVPVFDNYSLSGRKSSINRLRLTNNLDSMRYRTCHTVTLQPIITVWDIFLRPCSTRTISTALLLNR
jgi:hypothetical protein